MKHVRLGGIWCVAIMWWIHACDELDYAVAEKIKKERNRHKAISAKRACIGEVETRFKIRAS